MPTVLIIDDSPSSRAKVASALSEAGHTAIEAGDGDSGFELAIQDQPDLCLVDDVMPGPSGLATIEKLRNDPRTANIPCVYMGRDDEVERRWATGAGAAGYLTRPFDGATAIAAVERLLPSSPAPSGDALRVVRTDDEWRALVSSAKLPIFAAFLFQGRMWRNALPELTQLADDATDALTVAVVDADGAPALAEQLQLRHAIPHYAVVQFAPDGSPLVAPTTIAQARELVSSRPR